jgi:glycosyltransferase involved in cell wall biosynthesis
MEALAAGLLVVTSDLGALPETCAGWARLVQPAGPGRTPEQFAIDFAREADTALHELQAEGAQFFRQRLAQSQAINDKYTWDVRAAEWEQAGVRWLNGR